jgi:hypothetical protein
MAYAQFYSSEIILVDFPLGGLLHRRFNHWRHLYSKAEITENNLFIIGSHTRNRFVWIYIATGYLALVLRVQ